MLDRLVKALEHRGPDGQGTVSFRSRTEPGWSISLAHTRLEIVGLGEIGDQPKSGADQGGLIFNGEIYGPTAEQSLRQAGISSDTQWIWEQLKATARIGPPKGSDGIWGMVSYDPMDEVISISRDPLGVVPVYVYEWSGGLVVASEIQAIAKAVGSLPINYDELLAAVASRQLSYGRYVDGLSCISPGETRKYGLRNGKVVCLGSSFEDYFLDYLEGNHRFDTAFDEAIYRQFQADVPLGVQLSGGIDSTLIAATLAHQGNKGINTFVARTNLAGHDEADFAIENARKLGLRKPIEVPIDAQAFSEEILGSFGNIDPAFSHPNFFAVKKIARSAREMGIKVLLCGEGADELFRGYSRLLPSNLARLVSSSFSEYVQKSVDNRRLNFDQCLPGAAKRAMHANGSLHYRWVEDPSLRHLFCNYLHELLYRQNIAGMAHSVEVRPPFLDFSVVGFAMNHPNAFLSCRHGKVDFLKGAVKSRLRDLFPGYTGPSRKSGFSMPLQHLLNSDAVALLGDSVKFSAEHLGIDRSTCFERFQKGELSTFEFERNLWPALVLGGAVSAAGHSIS
ncbi:asparagine synthase-related protein [Halomonas sp. H10-9-1]|uniref:asparagine synthetase B family protein n=1 Tax=Halomonas sp. H10-9-1 TaxID=2950871 RepID=UPI0032DEA4C7